MLTQSYNFRILCIKYSLCNNEIGADSCFALADTLRESKSLEFLEYVIFLMLFLLPQLVFCFAGSLTFSFLFLLMVII